MKDAIIRATLRGGAASLVMASTGALCEEARALHGASPVAAAALGRALTMTAMLSLSLKDASESLTVTIEGGGPLGRIVACGRAPACVKGYVANPALKWPPAPSGKLDVGGAVGRDGMLSLVRDLGLKEPYVGRSHLVSGEIAEDFALYLTASEQTPSLVALGVFVGGDGRVASAGGVLAQPLPDCPDAVIAELERKSENLRDISSRAGAFDSADDMLLALFGDMAPEILRRERPAYRCDCARGRVERALIATGPESLRQMRDEDGGAELDCAFCRKRYEFSRDDLTRLIESSAPGRA